MADDDYAWAKAVELNDSSHWKTRARRILVWAKLSDGRERTMGDICAECDMSVPQVRMALSFLEAVHVISRRRMNKPRKTYWHIAVEAKVPDLEVDQLREQLAPAAEERG